MYAGLDGNGLWLMMYAGLDGSGLWLSMYAGLDGLDTSKRTTQSLMAVGCG